MSDTEELLERAGQGDQHARAELLDRYRERLRRMVAVRFDRRLLARLDPSDVVQEALVEASQKLSEYFSEATVPFYLWLRRLTWEHLVRLHHRHVNAGRRSVAREEFSLFRLPDESAIQILDRLVGTLPGPDAALIDAEIKTRLLQGLAELSEQDRDILVLRYLEQLSGREVAEVLQITESAARQRLGRALERLTQKMGHGHADGQ